MTNYLLSLCSILSSLKIWCWFWIGIGVFISWQSGNTGVLALVGASVFGFFLRSLFDRKDTLLLRGVADTVYLLQNSVPFPHIYKLADRETMNAFGGRWDQISHVSESFVNHLYWLFGSRRRLSLSLKQAKLWQARGQETIYAVLDGKRYGIPNPETFIAIWGRQAVQTPVSSSQLDKLCPGRDLVSFYFWPSEDKARKMGEFGQQNHHPNNLPPPAADQRPSRQATEKSGNDNTATLIQKLLSRLCATGSPRQGIENDERHRTLEYDTVRKEMTDRLLWVYGLLPAAVTTVSLYLGVVLSKDFLAPSTPSTPSTIPIELLFLPLIGIVMAFCLTTRNLLCNIYNSGSYLIVYHELDSKYQYLLRSRFRGELKKGTANAWTPRWRLEDTGPTASLVYLITVLGGIALTITRYGWPSPSLSLSWSLLAFVLIVLGILLLKLWRVKSKMEKDLLEYKETKIIQDPSYVLEKLATTHAPPTSWFEKRWRTIADWFD